MNLEKTTSQKNKTIKILLILMTALIVVISLVVYNAFFSFDRTFTVLHAPQLNICYLISNDYTYEVTEKGFNYAGKKNTGTVSLKEDFSDSIFKPNKKLNGFEYGYQKVANFRLREYRINNSTVLLDEFEMKEKSPMHLVPERQRCEIFLKRFTHHQVIFADKK